LGVTYRRGCRLLGAEPTVPGPDLPISDGFYEDLHAEVLHLPYPMHVVKSEVPTVFTIHDLQHRHFPQFFSAEHLRWRETVFPAMFEHARSLTTVSRWVKADLVRQYGVDAAKVHVIHSGSPTEAYDPVSQETIAEVTSRLRLPKDFMLYPALTYEHKNHVRLLEAVALLRDRGRTVSLVCTGTRALFWPTIRRRLRELRLEDQIRFVGFVSTLELTVLYRTCRFVIFPSLFEGAGLPLLEAFREGAPIACSDIPALREYGGDAALFFDPTDVESIAQAIGRMFSDPGLGFCLRSRGADQIRRFSWERAAMMYLAVYRMVAGRSLSPDDRCLLAESLGGGS
jgi:glycosyltransferase involved in cell wall biosynthesis